MVAPERPSAHRFPKVLSENELIIAYSDYRPGIARPAQLRPIQGAANPATAAVEHVRADRRSSSSFLVLMVVAAIRQR